MRALVLSLALLAPVLAVSGCFDFEEPACSYKCGPDSTCPDDYECRQDGYCHQIGSSVSCLFTDAAVPDDLSVPDLGPDFQDQDMTNLDADTDLGDTD